MLNTESLDPREAKINMTSHVIHQAQHQGRHSEGVPLSFGLRLSAFCFGLIAVNFLEDDISGKMSGLKLEGYFWFSTIFM